MSDCQSDNPELRAFACLWRVAAKVSGIVFIWELDFSDC